MHERNLPEDLTLLLDLARTSSCAKVTLKSLQARLSVDAKMVCVSCTEHMCLPNKVCLKRSLPCADTTGGVA